MATTYKSKYANGAAVDAALDKAGTAVQPSDVVNTLDSTSTTAPLSAAQGKALNDGKQPLDSDLTAIAGLTTTGLIERTGAGTAGIVTVTAAGKALLDAADAAAQIATLGAATAAQGGKADTALQPAHIDTDSATTALHHTLGTGANQAAAGNHAHSGVYEPADATILKQANIDNTPVDGVTTKPISSNWAFDHAASTQAHGVSGTVVGTSDTQTLTNKTITNYKEGRYATTTSADITLNLANGNVQRLILDANRQITMPADPGDVGQSFVLIIECATFTPTWNSSPAIEWLTADGLAPTLVTTANLVNVLTFIWDDTDSRWLGFLAGKES